MYDLRNVVDCSIGEGNKDDKGCTLKVNNNILLFLFIF